RSQLPRRDDRRRARGGRRVLRVRGAARAGGAGHARTRRTGEGSRDGRGRRGRARPDREGADPGPSCALRRADPLDPASVGRARPAAARSTPRLRSVVRRAFLHRAANYDDLWNQIDYHAFDIPAEFNAGGACPEGQDPSARALTIVAADDSEVSYTFG